MTCLSLKSNIQADLAPRDKAAGHLPSWKLVNRSWSLTKRTCLLAKAWKTLQLKPICERMLAAITERYFLTESLSVRSMKPIRTGFRFTGNIKPMSIARLTPNQKHRYRHALAKMPVIFTVGMYRAQLGITEPGQEWADAAMMLQSFKKRGIIRRYKLTRKWEKVFRI
jgi:hypothetical protein